MPKDEVKIEKASSKPIWITFGIIFVLVVIAVAFADDELTQDADTTGSNSTVQEETQLEPHITTKTETEIEEIDFEEIREEDATLEKDMTVVSQEGVKGEKTITYKVTFTDGKVANKEKVGEEVTKEPVKRIVKVGTKVPKSAAPTPSCDPNYSGACVPIASDVDCGGGSGNGPEYLYGTAKVIGSDIYDLDRDNDGLACE